MSQSLISYLLALVSQLYCSDLLKSKQTSINLYCSVNIVHGHNELLNMI